MKSCAAILVALLLTATLRAQSAAAPQAQSGAGNAAPANPPAPGLTGSGAPDKAAAPSQPASAPASDSRVYVTGVKAIRTGSIDRPLLPIASAANAFSIRSGTPIQVRLKNRVSSGDARNGQMLDGTLAAPLPGLPVGTPVQLTVVQSSPAGRLYSFGELSLQVVSIRDRTVLSDTVTAQGHEGAKELPDAAPARGTEAVFTPDQTIALPAA